MLLINAKRNQTIRIGSAHRLTVREIDEDTFTITFLYENKETALSRRSTIKVGVPVNVIRGVLVTMTRINTGRELSVTLGFDAPRDIKIRGDWVGQRNHKTDYVTLQAMPPAELIATAAKEATTDLELVLLENLQVQPFK